MLNIDQEVKFWGPNGGVREKIACLGFKYHVLESGTRSCEVQPLHPLSLQKNGTAIIEGLPGI